MGLRAAEAMTIDLLLSLALRRGVSQAEVFAVGLAETPVARGWGGQGTMESAA